MKKVKKTKNILFLTPRDSKKYLGGVEKHIRLLTAELVKRDYQVTEFSLNDINPDKILAWRYLWHHRSQIESADIIHIHDIFWWFFPIYVWLVINFFIRYSLKRHTIARGFKEYHKVYITFHGWEGKYPPSKSAIWQKKLAQKLCAGSIGVGKYLEKWYKIKLNEVTYGVINSQNLLRSDLPPPAGGSGSSENRIAVLGRLEKVNGIEVVLKAAGQMKAAPAVRSPFPWSTSLPRRQAGTRSANRRTGSGIATAGFGPAKSCLNIKFLFVGDGCWRKQAETIGRVTGMVKNVNKYLAKADVVIASSYLSIMEAMALGKPVIAITDNPLKKDYLKCHPMAGNFKTVETAEELLNLMRSDLTLHPGNFKGRTSKKWALEQTAEKLVELYLKLWKRS